jgi:branched-chain amino acid transport system substrate-binding protein
MKKLIWWLIVLVIILGSIYVWWWTNNREPVPADKAPVRIGAVLPLTGIAAIVGETEQKGIELAVEEINKEGGINGRKLEIIFENDQTDPKNTVSAISKLVSVDKVVAIIGGTWDFLANAAIPVAEANKVVLVSPSALPDTLERTSSYFFVTHSPVANLEPAIVRFLSQFKNGKIVIISVNNLWGRAHLDTFKKSIQKSGNQLTKEIILPNFDNNDIQRELTLIKNLKPDAIIVALNFGDSVSFLRKKSELRVSGKVLADFHVEDNYNKGNLSEELVKDVTLFVFSDPTEDFVRKYYEKYQERPKTYADTSYDAVYVLKLAFENSEDIESDKVLAGLRQVKNYQGASGLINFSSKNFPENKKAVLKIFKNHQFIQVQD